MKKLTANAVNAENQLSIICAQHTVMFLMHFKIRRISAGTYVLYMISLRIDAHFTKSVLPVQIIDAVLLRLYGTLKSFLKYISLLFVHLKLSAVFRNQCPIPGKEIPPPRYIGHLLTGSYIGYLIRLVDISCFI